MIHLRPQVGITSDNTGLRKPEKLTGQKKAAFSRCEAGALKSETAFCFSKARSRNEAPVTGNYTNAFINQELSKKYKRIGDKNFSNQNDNKAVLYYQEAIKTNPEFPSPYYNLAKIYKKQNNIDKAIATYQQLLSKNPDEIEAQTLMGNCFKTKGDYNSAKNAFEKAVKTDPKYDFAQRSLSEVNNLILTQENPIKAQSIENQVKQHKLRTALALVNQHADSSLSKGLQNVDIVFGETDSLSGVKNIAQYENHNNRIVITNDYIWAAPEITAAYMMHEAVHARDRDGLSSVREEQDAYHASIEFWVAHNNGIKDPELDFAASLYKENPQKLARKVADTYRSRDNSIPEYSPNHIPPSKQGLLSRMKMYFLSTTNKYTNKTISIS